MDSHQSDGKLNPRFSSFWKGKDKGKQAAPEGSATANDNQKQPAAVDIKLYNDGDRTLGRYKEAAIILDKAIKSNKGPWKSLDVPDISGEPESFDDIQFRNKLNGVLDSWENSVKDRAGWGKVVRHAVETVFTALSPFAKNALNIANNSQSVQIVHISFPNRWPDWGDESLRFAVLRSPSSCNCNYTLTGYIDDRLPIKRLRGRMMFPKFSTTFANNLNNSISLGKSLKKSHTAIR